LSRSPLPLGGGAPGVAFKLDAAALMAALDATVADVTEVVAG
jgi:hypothetical protein